MPIPPNLIFDLEVIIKGTAATGGAGAKPVWNVFHYQRASSVPAFTKAAFEAQFITIVGAPLAAAMNVRWTCNGITVRVLNDYQDAEQFFPNILVGARILDSLPLNSAVTVQLKTNLRGRSFKGSKHFSPASEEDTTQDILTGAGLARWQAVRTACGATLVDANGNNWQPAVYSPTLSNPRLMPVADIIATPVTSVLLDSNMGTMKKRRSRTLVV